MPDEDALNKIAELEAQQARRDHLRPLRLLLPLAQDADRDPEGIDWQEAVETLEAALVVARVERRDAERERKWRESNHKAVKRLMEGPRT